MMGQGITPEQYHTIVDLMSSKEQEAFLTGMKNTIENVVDQLPSHEQYLKQYCPAQG